MPDFTLVDLDSQADAVARHVQGWKAEEILEWMRRLGKVTKLANRNDERLYIFRSGTGIETGFRFTEGDQLVIVRAHTTYQPDSTGASLP